jgi:hypothetical protein
LKNVATYGVVALGVVVYGVATFGVVALVVLPYGFSTFGVVSYGVKNLEKLYNLKC